MEVDALSIEWWMMYLCDICYAIKDLYETSSHPNELVNDIKRCKDQMEALIPTDILPSFFYKREKQAGEYPVYMISEYIRSTWEQKMLSLDEIGRLNVLFNCRFLREIIELSDFRLDNDTDLNDIIDDELYSFCCSVVEEVHAFAWCASDLINRFDLDVDKLRTRFLCDDSDAFERFLHLSGHKNRYLDNQRGNRHKNTGRTLTVRQRVLAITTLLEQLGITDGNTDKTRIATFATGVMGRNMDIKPANSSVYDALKKSPVDQDFDAVRNLFNEIGLQDIANKLKQ